MTLLGALISWPFRLIASVAMQPDKQGHLYWGMAMGLAGLWLGWWALVPVVLLAFGKEVWDRSHPPHQVEALDAICTIIGGACSIGLIVWRLHHG